MATKTKKTVSKNVKTTKVGVKINVAQAVRLLKKGAVLRDVAQFYGVSVKTLYKHCGDRIKGVSRMGRRWKKIDISTLI